MNTEHIKIAAHKLAISLIKGGLDSGAIREAGELRLGLEKDEELEALTLAVYGIQHNLEQTAHAMQKNFEREAERSAQQEHKRAQQKRHREGKPSDFQLQVLEMLVDGVRLSHDFEPEGVPYRPSGGYYSAQMHVNGRFSTVPYRTTAALLAVSWIEESGRFPHKKGMGNIEYTETTVTYAITDAGRSVVTES